MSPMVSCSRFARFSAAPDGAGIRLSVSRFSLPKEVDGWGLATNLFSWGVAYLLSRGVALRAVTMVAQKIMRAIFKANIFHPIYFYGLHLKRPAGPHGFASFSAFFSWFAG